MKDPTGTWTRGGGPEAADFRPLETPAPVWFSNAGGGSLCTASDWGLLSWTLFLVAEFRIFVVGCLSGAGKQVCFIFRYARGLSTCCARHFFGLLQMHILETLFSCEDF